MRFRLKIIDRFILKNFLFPFFGILMIVIFILMLQSLWLYIDELVGKGLRLKIILEFLMWGCAISLPLSLPLATLLSSVMTMGSMAENNELVALKSAGVSTGRVLAPFAVASFLISVGAFFVSNNLVPMAYNEIYTLRDDIIHTKGEIKVPVKSFYDGIDGYIMRIEDKNEETTMMYDMVVYDHTDNKKCTNVTVADSATMFINDAKTMLVFEMHHGMNYSEENSYRYRDTTRNLTMTSFDHQTLSIPLSGYAFHKSEVGRFSDEVNSLSIKQLYHNQDSLQLIRTSKIESQIRTLRTEGLFRFATQLDTNVYVRYRTDYENDDVLYWPDVEEKLHRSRMAINKANEMIATLSTFGRESYRHNFFIRHTDVGILKKYANALACFIFFLIGAPLGALMIKKKGLGVPMIIAVLFFVLYWVVDISGVKLARDGAATAFNGVFISAYVLLPLGLLLTWASINDSKVLNFDFKAIARKIKTFIMSIFHKTRIVYMGTPEFAVAPLESLLATRHSVVGVVTVADKALGRGMKLGESAVKKFAVSKGLPVLQPTSLKDPEFISALKALKPDLIVVVAFRMLPKVVWEIPSMGTFNLHAALLPQYRGAAPINWAIINGERTTGVTTFMIDEGIDTGKIMMREQYFIKPSDSLEQVHDALMAMGAELVVRTVDSLIEKNTEFRLQKTYIQGSEVLKPAPKLTKELLHIDWRDSSIQIHNLIRGLSPYPCAYTNLLASGCDASLQLKVFASHVMTPDDISAVCPSWAALPAGSIISDEKTIIAVRTLDGAISLDEVQISGKKRMPVRDFLLGFRNASSYTTDEGTSASVIRACRP